MTLFPIERIKARIASQPPLRDDARFPSGKIAFFQYLVVGTFVFLISGFWELQIRNPEFYNERAERNRIKSQPILAPRGKILDRDGRVIVDSHSSFSLALSRDNLNPAHLGYIAEGLGLDPAEVEARLRRFRSRPSYEAIIIKEELTPGELAFVEAHRDSETFPELELLQDQRRLYPRDGLAAHVIGYVGEVSEAELDAAEFARYNQGDVIGKSGIERQYNEILMGVDGQRRVMVDNRGKVRTVMGIKEAVPGKNLQLTIDLDLQAVAELAMENRRGAVVALDPRNGDVLAMVSHPAFDPNKFAGRIRNRDWMEIISDPEKPLLNRALQAQLAPGSTFKPIVALAGLESGAIDDQFQVHCGGGAAFYGRYFKCHIKGGHGNVELHKGLTQSCDVFFYNAGNRMGIDKIAQYAELVGLGRRTGIDLPHEAEGLVPSSKWKARTLRQKWYAGETISVSIGQGALTVTPLQMAYAMGGLATGGVWHRPHLVRDRKDDERARRVELNLENLNKVIDGMYGVVNEGGTGGRARLPGLEVCGKTGTAQLASNEVLKGTALGRTMKDNAWFVGFAPRQAPEIVVVALFEGGEHGPAAAPIVRDVLKVYFDKKARQAQRQTQMARLPNLLGAPPGPGQSLPGALQEQR
ncbi:MAG: penicillin-binding protein 2 [Acidobacteria bacterium]|nr:penicillin-binding protein 2 [Acidobacteriota bacterium]